MIDALLVESVAPDDEVRLFLQHVQRETHQRIAQLGMHTEVLVGATRGAARQALTRAEGHPFQGLTGPRDH